jgi:hypothetical protein
VRSTVSPAVVGVPIIMGNRMSRTVSALSSAIV